MRGPDRIVPRHVAACQHSPLELERWFVYCWQRTATEKQIRIPYCCNSWRCDVCRRFEAAVTFARLKQAVAPPSEQNPEGIEPRGWVMLVLTLDRDGYYGGKRWRDVNEAYAALGKMSRKVLDRIGRVWGSETRVEVRELKDGTTRVRHIRHVGNRWVAVVEAHRSGWPHMNLMVWCPELADELRAERDLRLGDVELADAVALARDAWKAKEPIPPVVRERARRAIVVGGRLARLVTCSGWGLESTAEAARDIEAVMAYGVKLAGMHDASVGELAKVTQCPLNAPVRFRRLRTGKGFLPERYSNPDVTGCLIRRRRSAEGDWEIQAVNAPKDPTQEEPVQRARDVELQLIAEEESILSRERGRLPAMPPMRLAVAGKLEGHKQTSERRSAVKARVAALAG